MARGPAVRATRARPGAASRALRMPMANSLEITRLIPLWQLPP